MSNRLTNWAGAWRSGSSGRTPRDPLYTDYASRCGTGGRKILRCYFWYHDNERNRERIATRYVAVGDNELDRLRGGSGMIPIGSDIDLMIVRQSHGERGYQYWLEPKALDPYPDERRPLMGVIADITAERKRRRPQLITRPDAP